MRLLLAVEARAEIDDAQQYYDAQRPGLGQQWLGELKAALRHLRDQPRLYPRVRGDVRSLTFGRFPYKLLYTIEGDHVLVIAVAHQKRRPDYWTDRLPTPDK